MRGQMMKMCEPGMSRPTAAPATSRRLWLAAGVSALVMSGGAGHAAESKRDEAAASVEEVVVTARFRAENLQEVPDTIHSFSAETIENTGARSVADIARLVPNLSLVASQDAGLVTINIRGIGQVRNGEPPVAIQIDGVQLSSPDQIRQPLFDLESVEVLKGPQGALYGRNAIGGAILIHTRRPTNEFENVVEAGYAEGEDRTLQAVSSGPIIRNKLFFRVAADVRRADGQIYNITTRHNVDGVSEVNVRGRLLFTPTEAFTLDLRGSYANLKTGGAFVPLGNDSPNNTSVPVQAGLATDSSRHLTDVSLKADYVTPLGTLSSVSSYSETRVHLYEQLGAGIPKPTLSAMQLRPARAISEDLRLTSTSDRRVRYTVGAYWLRNEPDIVTTLYTLNSSFRPVLTIPVARTNNTAKAYAFYGQTNIDLSPELELTLAARYDHQKVDQVNALKGSATTSVSFDAVQPKVSLAYKFKPGASVYATYAEGFRSGGLNAPNPYFPLVYEAERTKSYEAGLKTTAFERTVVFDVAAYHTDFKNQAVFTLAPGAVQGITSIPSTTLYGLDASANWHVTSAFDLSAGLGWNHSRINNFDGTAKYVGNKSPGGYQSSFNLGAQYVATLAGHDVTARIDYSRKEGLYWHVDNADKQSPVDLVNARLIADLNDWKLSLYAINLLDEKHIEEFCAKEFCGGVQDLGWPSRPRQVGVSARYTF
ncbi:MAG TPA: TonB-dependent receptor [Phenylobacterium sp.]|nr:TonB-dependent receptor [Phenylobacterium sp.]